MRGFHSVRPALALALALALLVLSTASAQTIPDVGFGGLGAGFVNLPLNQGGLDRDMGGDMQVRPDGRIVIAGSVQTATGLIAGVYQLTADGLPDAGFGGGDGRATFIDPGEPGATLVVNALALQSDGKIVLAGQANGGSGFVMRVLANGTALDVGFDGDGVARPSVTEFRDVAIDGDNRIVLAGVQKLIVLLPQPGYVVDRIAVTRLQPDGALDASFGGNGRPYFDFGSDDAHDYRGRALTFGIGGRILVAAEVWTPDHGIDFGVLGLLEGGTPDPNFGNYGPIGRARVHFDQTGATCTEDLIAAIGSHHSILFPATDRILLAGQACLNDGNREFAVARLFANGELDIAFADTGRKLVGFDLGGLNHDSASSLAFQTPNLIQIAGPTHLVVAGVALRGSSANYDIAIARLQLSDGALDSTFGIGGRLVFPIDLGGPNTEFIETVATSASRITVAGWLSTPLNGGNDRDFLAARFVAEDRLLRNGFE